VIIGSATRQYNYGFLAANVGIKSEHQKEALALRAKGQGVWEGETIKLQ